MVRTARAITNRRGISLVELLTAMAVGSILAGVVYTFIMFSSKTLRKITAMQLMQQESSMISEVFMRGVRNGSFVCVGNDTLPPAADSNNVLNIMVRDADSSEMASFSIENNFFMYNWHLGTNAQILSKNLYELGNTSNHFKVFQQGDHVEFYLNLHRTVGDDTVFLSQTVGDVRCKNKKQ
jgi:prepilin-type N-terminal cleavage/methylation domain-containing protein